MLCPLWFALSLSGQGDYINLYGHIFWQARYLYSRPGGRRGSEILSVDFVHGSEITHIFQEDRSANYFLQPAARSLKNPGQVFHNAVGLCRDISGDDLLRGWVDSYLSRYEYKTVSFDGLGIRAYRFGTIVG